jgi:hypothetical protein
MKPLLEPPGSQAGMATTAMPQAAPQDTAACAQAGFFAALAVTLGLPPAEHAGLRAHTLFTGPAGLPCRVAWQAGGAAWGARPEILLPLSADELAGPDVRRLLAVQAALLSESGWYLGLSGEGLLQVAPLLWMTQPADVAAALDAGSVLGSLVLQHMAAG